MRLKNLLPAPLLLLAGALNAQSLPVGCDTFSWDVADELAVLRTEPRPIIVSDGSPGSEVRIELGSFRRAILRPQAEVRLAARPGKPMLEDDASGGLLTFRVPEDGRYRVSITTGHWIDVVDNGQVVRSLDFQGRRGCPLVHKIVEYDLPAGRDLQLQFIGGAALESGVAITRVRARK
ncbi:hypothetical protein EBB59_00800 [Lysobacter pythonis]|uniref:Homogentisate 1,2-dioxygenase n=1 Tax=Solilutibacter pythonis TaxID=2483112 RepID=A0A3M2I3G5_9GAMM|nr:hypothetical protein [Lysobacter pythonis]RMH94865.1 hypothetical protein EBB59_00800 [Lysobacter pythonis]